MDKEHIFKFIHKRHVAVISTVDGNGFPVMRAMLKPRKIEDNTLWFSTNTSSNKVSEISANSQVCVYFYRKGLLNIWAFCCVVRQKC